VRWGSGVHPDICRWCIFFEAHGACPRCGADELARSTLPNLSAIRLDTAIDSQG
jgi:hypothetical protein